MGKLTESGAQVAGLGAIGSIVTLGLDVANIAGVQFEQHGWLGVAAIAIGLAYRFAVKWLAAHGERLDADTVSRLEAAIETARGEFAHWGDAARTAADDASDAASTAFDARSRAQLAAASAEARAEELRRAPTYADAPAVQNVPSAVSTMPAAASESAASGDSAPPAASTPSDAPSAPVEPTTASAGDAERPAAASAEATAPAAPEAPAAPTADVAALEQQVSELTLQLEEARRAAAS